MALGYAMSTGQWASEMYRCHTNQIGANSNYKQPIKLPLVKVNHVCENFIPILEWPSLFFYIKQKQVFLYSSYSDISNAVFTVVTLLNTYIIEH